MDTNSASSVPGIDLAAPLTTDQDLVCRVDHLVDQDSRRHRSLWLFFLSGDGVQLPVVVPIDGVPERPDGLLVGNLCGVIAQVLGDAAPGGSAVLTLARPGDAAVDDTDRYWFRALHAAARQRGTAIRLICLATPAGVRRLTIDDAG